MSEPSSSGSYNNQPGSSNNQGTSSTTNQPQLFRGLLGGFYPTKEEADRQSALEALQHVLEFDKIGKMADEAGLSAEDKLRVMVTASTQSIGLYGIPSAELLNKRANDHVDQAIEQLRMLMPSLTTYTNVPLDYLRDQLLNGLFDIILSNNCALTQERANALTYLGFPAEEIMDRYTRVLFSRVSLKVSQQRSSLQQPRLSSHPVTGSDDAVPRSVVTTAHPDLGYSESNSNAPTTSVSSSFIPSVESNRNNGRIIKKAHRKSNQSKEDTASKESNVCEKCTRVSQICTTLHQEVNNLAAKTQKTDKSLELMKELTKILAESNLVNRDGDQNRQEIKYKHSELSNLITEVITLKEEKTNLEKIIDNMKKESAQNNLESSSSDSGHLASTIQSFTLIKNTELYKKQLEIQQKKQYDFDRELRGLLEDAQEKIAKLQSVSQESNVLKMAEDELISFEALLKDYKEALELNIILFSKTGNIYKLIDLPKYPSLSQVFEDKFSELVSIIPPETGIPDTDCLICQETRNPDDQVEQCQHCPYIYHSACLLQWFQSGNDCQNCPNCRNLWNNPT